MHPSFRTPVPKHPYLYLHANNPTFTLNRTLICKVEEIHTTLRKHLAKEEEQLLPLLLQHFSFAEQAELVAQFLYR